MTACITVPTFIYIIGADVYKINDPGDPEAILGGLIGTDIYLICGESKALIIDLGNNYIDGYEKDLIKPRENAKEEFLEVVNKLIGKRPLEVAVSHMHPDHSGMTNAFPGTGVPLWIGEGEDMERLKTMHGIDPSIYKIFGQGKRHLTLEADALSKHFCSGVIQMAVRCFF